MYKKKLGHFAMVSLKYFFDFDYTLCHSAYMMIMMVPFMSRMLISAAAHHIHDGLLTVQEDVTAIKASLAAHRQEWEQGGMWQSVENNFRVIRQNLIEKDVRIR